MACDTSFRSSQKVFIMTVTFFLSCTTEVDWPKIEEECLNDEQVMFSLFQDEGVITISNILFAWLQNRQIFMLVFNIVLKGSFQRNCYEPGSTMLKKRDVMEAKLKVWGDKKACAFGTTLLRKQNSPRHIIFRNSMQNIIFLSLEKVFQN